jgi:hypothetical protein
MDHGVAVWTNGSKICDRINPVLFLHRRKRSEMVDMNEVLPYLAVPVSKIEFAYRAIQAVVRYTLVPSRGISLISVNYYCSYGTFNTRVRIGDFVWMRIGVDFVKFQDKNIAVTVVFGNRLLIRCLPQASNRKW